jgi:hypothetical protein
MVLVKLCRFTGYRCYRSSCSIFDRNSGDVGVCSHHLNPDGFLLPRRVSGAGLSILQIWATRR